MNITAAMVKELREISGAGMMDCKKALTASDGDMDAAIEYLRKAGIATAAKKAGRIAAEGLVAVAVSEDQKTGAIVEVNSETDFVAKNAIFQEFVSDVAHQALDTKATDMDGFMAEAWEKDPSITVKDGLVAKDTVKEAAKNVAMQVAALNPRYNTRDDVPQEFLEHERAILMEQASKEGKPEAILKKMVEGRLNKELKEYCLQDQVYFRDDELTVGKYLKQVSKEVGCEVTVTGYVRYETGEGIEKKQEDFAAEVAKQMGQ